MVACLERLLFSQRQAVAYLDHRRVRHQVVAYLDQHNQTTDSQVVLDQLLVEQDLHLVHQVVLTLTSTDHMQCLTLRLNRLDFYQQSSNLR